MAEAPDEVIAAVVVVELPPAEIVKDSSAAVVVPPMAPTVRLDAVPVELRASVSNEVAVTIVPIVETAPATVENVSDCRAAAFVTLPTTRPALSSAFTTSVCV